MFTIDKLQNIKLTRGDSASMDIKIYDNDGNERAIKDTDTVTLTIKQNSSSTAILTKTLTEGNFIILPSDTTNLDVGLYVYDVQLTTNEGNIYTVIPQRMFNLTEEITR